MNDPRVIDGRQGKGAGGPAPQRGFVGLLRSQDPFKIALFFLTIVTISRVHDPLGLGSLRPALLLAAGALAYAVLNPRVVNWHGLFRQWPPKVIAALAVVACLSAAFGISLGGSARYLLEEFSKVLVFTALLVAAFRKTADVQLIVTAYVISAAILVFFTLFVFELQATNTGMMRLSNLYTYDANDVGLVLLVSVPLALWLLHSVGRREKIFVAFLILGVGAALARSGSRGAFVGIVALALALVWFVRHISLGRRLLIVGTLGVGLLIMAPEGYWEQMRTILEPTDDYNWTDTDGRRQLAERGFGYMMDYPLFGIGLGNFPRAEGLISIKAENHVVGTGLRWTPAHNSYVQVAAELGLSGLVLWSSLLLGCLVGSARLRRRMPRAWARGDPEQRFLYAASMYLPAAFVAFAVPAVFLSFAWRDILYLLAAIFCGVQTATRRQLKLERGQVGAAPRRGRRRPEPLLGVPAHHRSSLQQG